MAHTYQLIRKQWLAQSLEATFAFFSRPENLEQITPPWLGFHIVSAEKELHAGSRIEYRLRVHGFPMRWISEITDWSPPHRFVDTQLRGPYAIWRHEHRFFSENDGTRTEDEVHYALPFGALGQLAHTLMVRRDVEAIFDFRQKRLVELLERR